MKRIGIEAENDDFFQRCLSELKARDNYTDAFLPLLQRYVTLTAMLTKLNIGIIEEEAIIEFTNKAGHTNQATSPKWRMFVLLNKEANQLARQLKLCPESAPRKDMPRAKKGFDLDSMKIA